jgi:diaminopimelate epimerase
LSLRFEKWQALGNDYIIIEQEQLPFELSATRVARLCEAHTGCHSDGLLLLSAPEDEDNVAHLRIFNPDGSEAELSGNGARQAILYLRRNGWTSETSFSLETAAGVVRPTIVDERTCSVEMGEARLQSPDFPAGEPDGKGTLVADGQELEFQHVNVGNPQCVIDVGDELEGFDVARVGAAVERHELFPNRTNVSFIRIDGDSSVRARIFERGVGETLSSGTGACGAAVAAVLKGATSPMKVMLDGGELEVAVDDRLNLTLTGWAEPVFAGEFSRELLDAVERS